MTANRTETRNARLIAENFDWPYTKALRALRDQIYTVRSGMIVKGVNYRDDWK